MKQANYLKNEVTLTRKIEELKKPNFSLPIARINNFNDNKKEMNYECSVCGMDEWCGTDGCPMDPQ